MSRNQSLLQKADLALSDLTNNGGVLNPEQADTFIRKLIKQPTIIRECRVVTMKAPKRKINRIGFSGRILRKAPTTGTALSQGQRVAPTTDQIELDTDEVIAEVRLPYDAVEDNIERAIAANNEASNDGPGGLRDTIIQMIAEYAARDIEDYAINAAVGYSAGPTSDDNDFMGLTNGYLALGNSLGNVVDFGGATVDKTLFKKGLFGMPKQYVRNRPAMKHYVSIDNEVEYNDTLANRGTPMGDLRIATNTPCLAYGSPVSPVAMMPDSAGLFCDPLNLIVGFWRQLSMEFDKDITARVYIIVLTARIGIQVEQADALVVYKNIQAPT